MKKKIYSALIGIGLVSLTLGIWGGVTMYKNRQATELIIQARNEERQKAEAESQTAAEEEIGIAPGQKEELTADPRDLNLVPILAQDQLTYKGKNYRRNQYVKAILCMGVDRSDTMTETKELGLAGQSDGIFLIAQDTARHTLKILMIPRGFFRNYPFLCFPTYLSFASNKRFLQRPYIVRFIIFNRLFVPSTKPLL